MKSLIPKLYVFFIFFKLTTFKKYWCYTMIIATFQSSKNDLSLNISCQKGLNSISEFTF